MDKSAAVHVKNVVKHYGDNCILNDLSMTVEKGTIYGLLGSSGCGKTTLLSCIVGRKGIDSGEIWVLGLKKGNGVLGRRIGYMPQELGLVGEFTVRDALYYFGLIYNMKNKQIEERFRQLSSLLDLPPANKLLRDCSGGQQRRVSFAVALVHNPELLILDEPTVGTDPILRDKIWNYLKTEVNENNITVIITTHYIDETREANKIGLLRGGKLLTEQAPTKLLALFQTETLEEVFLILSQKQEQNHGIYKYDEQNRNSLSQGSTSNSVESFAIGYGSQDELTKTSKKMKIKVKAESMSALNLNRYRMKALLDKNWKQFYRNIGNILFLLTFPLMQLWFFTNSVGVEPKNLNLGIVNNESYTTLCDQFNWNETATIQDYDCHFQNLACRFLTYLEHPMINKVLYDSLPDAIEGIQHGQILGALYIPSNFSKSFQERVRLGTDAQKWITDFGEIQAHMDLSNRQTGLIMKYKLLDLYYQFQKHLLADCNLSEKLAKVPAAQNHFLYLDNSKPMTYFLAPGMVLMMVYLLGSTMTSNLIVKEKLDGVWDRSIIAGVSAMEIILSHLILEAAIMFIQSIECVVMVFFLIGLEYVGSLYELFFLIYLEGICGMAYGFFISSICNEFRSANILCTGGYLPLLLICGLIWPIEAMPRYLQTISMLTPGTIPILSFRNIMSKGWSLWDSRVINAIGVILAWIFIFASLSVWLIKIKK